MYDAGAIHQHDNYYDYNEGMTTMTTNMRSLYYAAAALLLLAGPVHAAGDLDILACGSSEKQAVSPTDKLNCEWKNGLFEATLAQLYGDGWRVAEAAFFDSVRPVLYLERPVVAAVPATP